MSWTPARRAAQAARTAAANRARKGQPRSPMTAAHHEALCRAWTAERRAAHIAANRARKGQHYRLYDERWIV